MNEAELSALRKALSAGFDTHPVAMLALSERGEVLWVNCMSRVLLPGLRRRMLFSRHVHQALPQSGAFSCTDPGGGGLLGCVEELEGIPNARVVFLSRMQSAFSEEFSKSLLEYEKGLVTLAEQTLRRGREKDPALREAYLDSLSEVLGEFASTGELIGTALKEVRAISPGRTMAVSGGELLSFLQKKLKDPLEKLQARLSVSSEEGVVALLNFRDFCRALLDLFNFFSCFVISGEIHIDLSRAQDGECVFDVWGEDRYHVLSLYRLFCRRGLSEGEKVRESAIFFPLFCALTRLSAYRHRVEIAQEAQHLHVRIFVRTTLELPALIVRQQGDALSLWLSEAAGEGLFCPGLLKHYRRILTESPAELPRIAAGVRQARLFD